MGTSSDWWRSQQLEAPMNSARPLYIPVILGTGRRGRFSAHVARFVAGELGKRDGVETELIDICLLGVPIDGAGEDIKLPELSAAAATADALRSDAHTSRLQ